MQSRHGTEISKYGEHLKELRRSSSLLMPLQPFAKCPRATSFSRVKLRMSRDDSCGQFSPITLIADEVNFLSQVKRSEQ